MTRLLSALGVQDLGDVGEKKKSQNTKKQNNAK